MKKETKDGKNWPQPLYCIDAEYRGRRFHYDGWRVEEGGKSLTIKVTTDDNTKGELFLPWEEIEMIRQFGWERQKDAAEKKMRGKRVHCRHLRSFNACYPECCQIGLNNGPHNINCLACLYIDGSIEEYVPDTKPEEIEIKDIISTAISK